MILKKGRPLLLKEVQKAKSIKKKIGKFDHLKIKIL
jgi:hypothetical protein